MPERQATSRFTYRGPISGMTLNRADAAPLEVMLYDGQDIDVPADHPHVVTLVAQGYLSPAAPVAAATPVAPATPVAETAAGDGDITSAPATWSRAKKESAS